MFGGTILKFPKVAKMGKMRKYRVIRVEKTSLAAKLPDLAFKIIFHTLVSLYLCSFAGSWDRIPKSLLDGCKDQRF